MFGLYLVKENVLLKLILAVSFRLLFPTMTTILFLSDSGVLLSFSSIPMTDFWNVTCLDLLILGPYRKDLIKIKFSAMSLIFMRYNMRKC